MKKLNYSTPEQKIIRFADIIVTSIEWEDSGTGDIIDWNDR